jgi:hypothetical protein
MGAMRAAEMLPTAAPAAPAAAQAEQAAGGAATAEGAAGGFARVLSRTRGAAQVGGKTAEEQAAETDETVADEADSDGLGALAAMMALRVPADAEPGVSMEAPVPAQDGSAACCAPDGASDVGGMADIRETGNAAELIPILEGTHADGTDNIAPKGADTGTDYKSADADLARMPQARMQTGTQQRISDRGDPAPAEMRDDMPCPLENADETPPGGAGEEDARQGSKPGDDDGRAWDYALPTGMATDAAPERVAAAEQLKAAPAERPVAREGLFDAMVERLEVMREDGRAQMTVELRPEYLGRVTLELTSAPDGGVNLRISAADPGVKGMIDGQVAALVENLSGKGVRLERVDVVYTGVGSGGYDGLGERPGERDSARSRGGRGRVHATAVGATAAIDLLQEAGLDAQESAYEYSA